MKSVDSFFIASIDLCNASIITDAVEHGKSKSTVYLLVKDFLIYFFLSEDDCILRLKEHLHVFGLSN